MGGSSCRSIEHPEGRAPAGTHCAVAPAHLGRAGRAPEAGLQQPCSPLLPCLSPFAALRLCLPPAGLPAAPPPSRPQAARAIAPRSTAPPTHLQGTLPHPPAPTCIQGCPDGQVHCISQQLAVPPPRPPPTCIQGRHDPQVHRTSQQTAAPTHTHPHPPAYRGAMIPRSTALPWECSRVNLTPPPPGPPPRLPLALAPGAGTSRATRVSPLRLVIRRARAPGTFRMSLQVTARLERTPQAEPRWAGVWRRRRRVPLVRL